MYNWAYVYSYLKSVNGETSKEELRQKFAGMDEDELKEGVIEYNIVAKREGVFKEVRL